MEYTVKQLSELAGVSPRTVRYYDEINLLKPSRINPNGYRVYTTREVDRLQQILLLRSLHLPLEEISHIIKSSTFDPVTALQKHLTSLKEQKHRLEYLIEAVEHTILYHKGERVMSDREKFEALKQQLDTENQQLYAQELKERYPKEVVEKSRKLFQNLTQAQFKEMQATEQKIITQLKELLPAKEYQGGAGKELASLHKKWLTFTLPNYSPQVHKSIAEMYVCDPRFTAYYDERAGVGAAQLLRDCIDFHIGL